VPSAYFDYSPPRRLAHGRPPGNLLIGARTFSAAKVRKPVTEPVLPLSERGSWAPPLEERGAGVSISFRPLGTFGASPSSREFIHRRKRPALYPATTICAFTDVGGIFVANSMALTLSGNGKTLVIRGLTSILPLPINASALG
jgi:hypothetical protein